MSKFSRFAKEQRYDELQEILSGDHKRDRKRAMQAVLRTWGHYENGGWSSDDIPSGAADLAVHTLRNDEDASVRRIAARVLVLADAAPSRAALMHALQVDDDKRVRETCAEGLSTGAEEELVVESLLTALTSDEDKSVRCAAASALAGACGDQRVVDSLLTALTSDEDKAVRRSAAQATAMCEDSRVQDSIAEAMQSSAFFGFHIPVGRSLAILQPSERDVVESALEPNELVEVVLHSNFPSVIGTPQRLIVIYQPAGAFGLVQGSKIRCVAIPYDQIDRILINEPDPGCFCVVPNKESCGQPWVREGADTGSLKLLGVEASYLNAWDPYISEFNYRVRARPLPPPPTGPPLATQPPPPPVPSTPT